MSVCTVCGGAISTSAAIAAVGSAAADQTMFAAPPRQASPTAIEPTGGADRTLFVPPPADADRTTFLPSPADPDRTTFQPAAADPDRTTFQPSPADADRTTFTPRAADADGTRFVPSTAAERTSAAARGRTLSGAPGAPAATWIGDTGLLEEGTDFGQRYHIIKLLGVGGMGSVYQAWDKELGVAVALKIIKLPEGADEIDARALEERFKRELLLARQVTHKSVVRIHDLGEIDGTKYITMTYVEGSDLSHILRAEGKLTVPRVLRIARQVLEGLAAAHDAGVVHRDLKPANIMIDADDQALIMDFGIALSSRDGKHKSEGIVGTLGYMSPQQATGQPVDQRTDLYALGLIMYDLLGGRPTDRPAESMMADMLARIGKAPDPIRTVNADVPEAVDRLITKCLEPNVDARYGSAAEIIADIDRLDENGVPIPVKRVVGMRILAAVITLLLALSGASWWYARRLVPAGQHEPVSVLISDFNNTTQDAAFDGSLEQALSTAMEGASFINSYPRADAVKLARATRVGDRLDAKVARLIAIREGVNVVLEGQIAKEGSGYRINVTAVDSSANSAETKPLASESVVARDKEHVLGAVGTVASKLRSVLGDTTPESARQGAAETATTTSLEALQAYTQAVELKRMNRNDEAMVAYDKAITLDPEFGRAYAGKGDIYMILKDEGKAKAAFDEALKHVNRMSEREKYRTFGNYYLNIARNNEKAIETFESFVKQYPADDGGHGNLGLAYLYTGNLPGAIAQVKQALRIYPKNALQRYNYAMYSLYAGDYDTAASEGSRLLEETPGFTYAYLPVAWSAVARGDFGTAADTYAKLEATGPAGAMRALLGRVDLEMAHGRFRPALALLQPGIAAAEKEDDAFFLSREQVAAAEAYQALGDKKRAAEFALKAAAPGGHESVLVPAARVLVAVGRVEDAKPIAVALEKMLQTQTIAYSRLISAEIALQQGKFLDAIETFNDSIKRRDTWLARYLRGRAYVETEHYTEALDDLGQCLTRRGEATDAFFYETPTSRYVTPVYYWLARAQQAVHVADAQKNFEQFLTLTAEADPADPLAADARKRLATK